MASDMYEEVLLYQCIIRVYIKIFHTCNCMYNIHNKCHDTAACNN